jgi:hypothetical protein
MADPTPSEPGRPPGYDVLRGSDENPCRPWKFWGTLAWSLLALAAWFTIQVIVLVLLAPVYGVTSVDDAAGMNRIATDGTIAAVAVLATLPVTLGVLALAVRAARCDFAFYLGLNRPRRREVMFGLALVVGCLVLGDIVTYLSGRQTVPDIMTDMYRSARDNGALLTLALALVVAAPVTEEITFRGFMFRGWSQSRLGVGGTIVVTSVIWAMMHVQYEPFHLLVIFGLGLIFGWLRWRSNSTTLTIILHAVVNLVALVQTAVVVAWAD